jgi:hypothetical protein
MVRVDTLLLGLALALPTLAAPAFKKTRDARDATIERIHGVASCPVSGHESGSVLSVNIGQHEGALEQRADPSVRLEILRHPQLGHSALRAR